MARRVFAAVTYTPTATADTIALTNATYQAINGGGAAQVINVKQIRCLGQAVASAVNIMQFARNSTVGVTPTALAAPNSDGPLHTATAALAVVPVTYVAAGTGPLRSAVTTLPRLNLSFNAYGGTSLWDAAELEGGAWVLVGNATSVESSLSAFTGGNVGLMGSHIIYEPL
jgi:hypothetical protein